MMLHDTTDNARSDSRTTIETRVAVASRFRILVASVRLEDAATWPCACSRRARDELPSVRNRASADFEYAPLGQRAEGESPSATADLTSHSGVDAPMGCPDPGESNVRTRFVKCEQLEQEVFKTVARHENP